LAAVWLLRPQCCSQDGDVEIEMMQVTIEAAFSYFRQPEACFKKERFAVNVLIVMNMKALLLPVKDCWRRAMYTLYLACPLRYSTSSS
jgi:hypothetical protein